MVGLFSMAKKLVIMSLLITVSIIVLTFPALAQPMCPDCPEWRERAPYGDYCPGPRWGWYGAKKTVRTADEAEKILKEYFLPYGDVKIGNIRERRWFFEADIKDKNNNLIDIVIVDKRTGRIRSIY